ncbi:MAG TPA: hypothetical protein PKY35_01565 [Candidatus Hydrogenedentes bacterium]|nr:hypothetical protein [Candidatus Hydrogenedentota bacterium]HOL75690.1 hypothetical protein [Candidatus Hydrogenedentota bacterium]HPO84317.1 hypothetical protein [Candidatus Hydrogenedentota bacterium]
MNSIIFLTLLVCHLSGMPSGQIAFVSGSEQEDRCVSAIDLKTGEIKRLGRAQRDSNPVWSPDGTKLAFESVQDGLRIFVVNHDGTDMKLVSPAASWSRWPAWSPDGKRLAFVSSDGSPENQIIQVYSMETNSAEPWGKSLNPEVSMPPLVRPKWLGKSLLVALLQARIEEMGQDAAPGWANAEADPQNTLLAIGFLGKPGRLTTGIFVVMPDAALLLPDDVMPSRGNYVEWAVSPSPNGKWVAFESNDGGDREIFVLSSKGAYNVSNHRAADWNPVWSPKGDRIAFESFREGTRGIYLVDPETSLVRRIVAERDADCWAPTWSPDGRWIAFVSTLSGNPELWVVNTVNLEKCQVTKLGGEALSPAWRPEMAK